MSETIEVPACAHLRVQRHIRHTDDGLTRVWWECLTCQARFAPLAAAREEARREIPENGHRCAHGSIRAYPCLLCSACRSSYDGGVVHFISGPRMREIGERHAAQLVALREAAVEAVERFGFPSTGSLGADLANAMRRSSADHLAEAARVVRALPLPDAEDALADAVRDTRIDTVRWCHANPVETSQAYEVEPADQYVARALNALESKP